MIAAEVTPEMISILPSVIFVPWKYRHIGCAVVDLHWLIFHLCFGEWILEKEQ